MNEKDLRDCFAMFAMLTQFFKADEDTHDARRCYEMADAMIEARKHQETKGLPPIKRRKSK